MGHLSENMRSPLKNKRGVALLLVISTIMFLTVVVTNFWADALMSHQMALNYRDRVKSYYLAESGMRFSKLILYYNKLLEDTLAKKKINLAEMGYQPLYKQIPISSEGLRGMIQAGMNSMSTGDDTETDDSQTEDVPSADEATPDSQLEDFMNSSSQEASMLKKEVVEEFLNFDGNFDAVIEEEQSKYSLNAISKLTSTSYDLYKKILLSMLLRPTFKNFFDNQETDAEKLVHAIADFVDTNSVINEFDQVERGTEDSIYKDNKYKIKNVSYLTLSELRLVEGMSDDIFEALRPLVTVYNSGDTINVCMADEQVVNALIVHYTRYSECTTPIDADDKEELDKLREEMLENCPDKSAVASALNVALGIKSEATTEDTASTAETQSTESQVSECKIQFEKLITDDNDIFNIQATGEVNGVRTTINEVIEVNGTKSKSWKMYYYQVN